MSRLSQSMHPAYHLRPNKAVDRLLFLEMVKVLDAYRPISKHTYVGFGGPFLEDFRLMVEAFPSLNMVSVEQDEETYKRQRFHICSSRIRLYHARWREFLASSFPSDVPTIVWADYTKLNRECLLECSDIARKAVPISIIRVTLPAETPISRALNIRLVPKTMPAAKKEEFAAFRDDYKKGLAVEGIAYDDSMFTWDCFQEEAFPAQVAHIVTSILQGSCSHPKVFLPLHEAKYSDGTIMLSVTGLICSADEIDKVRTHFERKRILTAGKPLEVQAIDVPVLTTKERLHLESVLPSEDGGKRCLNRLGYLLEGDRSFKSSAYKMEQYEKYYRLFPFYGKLIP